MAITETLAMATATTETLAHAAQAGDGDAVAELFRRIVPRARRAAAAYCGSSDVDDAVAEGFTRALARLDQLRQPSSVEAWIVRCAVRAAADLSRRHARQELGGSASDLEVRHSSIRRDFRSIGLSRMHPSAADNALSALDHTAVRRALADLSDNHRRILWLRFHDGWSVKEIAERLGLPDGTARRRCFEATRALAQRYLIEQLRPAEGECAPVTVLLCRSMDRQLGPTSSRRVDLHLRRCSSCRDRRAALDELLAAKGRPPACPNSPGRPARPETDRLAALIPPL
jgi:RNA polymerase sigma-70 factor (ECF subfamily)